MKQGAYELKSGVDFDNGNKTIDFSRNPEKYVCDDSNQMEPPAVAQDLWAGNWTTKASLKRAEEVGERLF